MTRWSDVQAHMRRCYQLQEDEPDTLSMVWSYEDGRSQKIVVRRFRAFGRDLLELRSAFARRQDVEPLAMLRKSAELPLATVALSDDVYVAVYNVLLDHLDFGDLDLLLSRIAAAADTMEEQYAHLDEF